VFEWDELAEADRYDIEIDEHIEGQWGVITEVVRRSTTSTVFRPNLPPLPENHYYRFRLLAYDAAGIPVGEVTVAHLGAYGSGSYAWGYNFKTR
jgi:hypothetical protein